MPGTDCQSQDGIRKSSEKALDKVVQTEKRVAPTGLSLEGDSEHSPKGKAKGSEADVSERGRLGRTPNASPGSWKDGFINS